LDKGRHPELAAAGAEVLAVLIVPAAALRPEDAEALLVTVAALAHGHAVFVLEGMLGPIGAGLQTARSQVRDAVARLIA
jgi:hypothetical protein